MGNDKFAEQIKKTGFFLEYRLGATLKEERWAVISNRYYIDDQSESVREIDLVAYKARTIQGFRVYTVLLISCKKSAKNVWALLSKDMNPNDPNADWRPVHVWTNEPAIEYMVAQQGWSDEYYSLRPVQETLSPPEVEVFAFQEMDKTSGTVQNDKAIFNSVTSLMKAQAYELSCLPARKENASVVYQFSLLSVADTDLVRLHFQDDERVEVVRVDSETYIANYIIKQQRTSARIHFVRESAFRAVLEDYSRLHEANCEFFDGLCDSFYKDVVKVWSKKAVFEEAFRDRIEWQLPFAIRRQTGRDADYGSVSLWYREDERSLAIQVELPEETTKLLNEDENLKRAVAKALRELYRYEGPFRFDINGIPF